MDIKNSIVWYVVQTQVNAEEKAKINLERQGFACFLPKYKKTIRHARQQSLVLRPLFPRYFFISLDLTKDRWRAVCSTVGVTSMIMNGESPAPINAHIIQEIMKRCNEEGLIELAKPNIFTKGDKVRITSGVFEEKLGLVEGVSDKDRVTIMINLLGREIKITTSSQKLEITHSH